MTDLMAPWRKWSQAKGEPLVVGVVLGMLVLGAPACKSKANGNRVSESSDCAPHALFVFARALMNPVTFANGEPVRAEHIANSPAEYRELVQFDVHEPTHYPKAIDVIAIVGTADRCMSEGGLVSLRVYGFVGPLRQEMNGETKKENGQAKAVWVAEPLYEASTSLRFSGDHAYQAVVFERVPLQSIADGEGAQSRWPYELRFEVTVAQVGGQQGSKLSRVYRVVPGD